VLVGPSVQVVEPRQDTHDEVDTILVALDQLEVAEADHVSGEVLAVGQSHRQPRQPGVRRHRAVDQRPHRCLDRQATAR
jgi:hypothetical protein